MTTDPTLIFKVVSSNKVKDSFHPDRRAALDAARAESWSGKETVVSNVYVKDGTTWERIAQFRNGTKIF